MRSLPLIALLAPALAFGQDKPAAGSDAAALLKKVEDRHVTAKTVHLKSTIKAVLGGKNVDFTCELWFGSGNRFKMTSAGAIDGMPINSFAVSDGKRLRLEGGPSGETRVKDLPKGLADVLRSFSARMGAMTAMVLSSSDKLETSGNEAIVALDVTAGADGKVGDKAAKVLTFGLKAKDEKDVLQAKIFFDADTLAVLRREMDSPHKESFIEPAVETTFDEELKDEVFVVKEVEEKKPEPKDEKKEEKKDK